MVVNPGGIMDAHGLPVAAFEELAEELFLTYDAAETVQGDIPVIPGAEPLFQRIADAMTEAIPEEWTVAEFEALFFPEGSTYVAEYVRAADGKARSFQTASDGSRAIRELRQLFRQAGRPVWGQVRFVLRADGAFDTHWGYDGCDANGDLLYDEEAAARWEEERRQRLVAGRPRSA